MCRAEVIRVCVQPELIERIPPLDESTYAGNLRDDVATIEAAAAATAGGATSAADLLGDLLDISDAPAADASAAVPASAAPAASAAEPRSVLDDLDDLLGGGAPAAAAPAAAPAAPAQPAASFRAWTAPQDGLEVDFACAAAAGASPPATAITATYRCGGAAALDGLRVLAAVPKGMTVEVRPADGDSLQPGRANAITQRMTAVNNTGGVKPLAMRLKVTYTVAGAPREHLGVVNGFPPGL